MDAPFGSGGLADGCQVEIAQECARDADSQVAGGEPVFALVDDHPDRIAEAEPVERRRAEGQGWEEFVGNGSPGRRLRGIHRARTGQDLLKVEAALRKVLIDTEPIGAKIWIGGRMVGETPVYVEWQGEVDVLVAKVGYKPVRTRLGPGTGAALKYTLTPAAP